MSEPATRYAVRECPECHRLASEGLALTVTGRTREVLFPWQERKVRGKAAFGPEHVHPEAEVRCESCTRTFWSLSPIAIEEARRST